MAERPFFNLSSNHTSNQYSRLRQFILVDRVAHVGVNPLGHLLQLRWHVKIDIVAAKGNDRTIRRHGGDTGRSAVMKTALERGIR